MKKNKQLLVAALGLFLASCGAGGGAKKTPGGVDFVVHKSGSGAQLKLGDTVLLNIIQSLNDSVMIESRKVAGGPVPFVITKSQNKLDLMDGLVMLKEGDSATFTIPIDSLPQKPPMAKAGDKLNLTFVVVGTYTSAKQKEKDDKVIKEYLDKNKLSATPTPEGVYVAVSQEGTGEKPQAGDTVVVHYTGRLTDGKVFDSSLDTTLRPGARIEPIRFPLGQGFVIKGWDAGIASLKKGAKATLLIPSTLGYGLQSSGPIPANSVLVFEVQLVDVVKGKPGAGAAPMAPAALQQGH
ncbi:FKBP-type peptidyl-prolyl cis-trans isomerase [Chitinophaga agri]|uniref:Peptidyl-prolyl cis-trans isomerase n=1 Tax=Chitinophaga agri TaxID=2703787 RepID=A0A6B9ZDF0_9BACT|nr:FKBP-type peptidyl-prolyl cis-trans isomerase [Chitinophaga agri]QHS59521.1 peptidylprolyl isomerase [Chitinophaga agri]